MPSCRCVVQDCSNRSNPKLGISLHKPKTTMRDKSKWKAFVRTHRANFNPKGLFKICSVHFTADCFERAVHVPGALRVTLAGAIPMIWKLGEAGNSSAMQKRSERLAVFTRIAVHQPFERTGMPFERLELTVLKNSSSVRTVRAIRSTKLISRSNSSSYPFEKIHQPFERLELSVRQNSSAVRTARAIHLRKFISRLNGSSYPFDKTHQPFERLELSAAQGSFENEALEKTKTEARSTQISKMKTPRSKTKTPKSRKRSTQNSKPLHNDSFSLDNTAQAHNANSTVFGNQNNSVDDFTEISDDDDDNEEPENDDGPDWTPEKLDEVYQELGDDNVNDSQTTKPRLNCTGKNKREEPKGIVFLSKLLLLFQYCHYCLTPNPETVCTQTGTLLTIKAKCSSCQEIFTWESQPFLTGKFPAGNLLLRFATLCAGASIKKMLTVFRHKGVTCLQ
ncbi:unnamed protein product [Porites evermanni]|uniref:THAP-type domain-containing protein n=1 Tax=Porites evermanni TaxID=104178 RepID=A0ABN8MH66_9CNID|nr:unnamed protein product [Porites evermanni]